MKKNAIALFLLVVSSNNWAQDVPEKFAREISKITQQYSDDMRQFLKSLPANTAQFNAMQQEQYCGIVSTYVNNFYQLTDKNRTSLPYSYANLTKQDIINKVEQSKEMLILKKYNIDCALDKGKQ